MTYQTRLYWHGAFAAFLNGLGIGFTSIPVAPDRFNFESWHGVLRIAILTAVAGTTAFFTYLKSHPLPDPAKDIDAASVVQSKIVDLKETMK